MRTFQLWCFQKHWRPWVGRVPACLLGPPKWDLSSHVATQQASVKGADEMLTTWPLWPLKNTPEALQTLENKENGLRYASFSPAFYQVKDVIKLSNGCVERWGEIFSTFSVCEELWVALPFSLPFPSLPFFFLRNKQGEHGKDGSGKYH